jgi:hypothetical protein
MMSPYLVVLSGTMVMSLEANQSLTDLNGMLYLMVT